MERQSQGTKGDIQEQSLSESRGGCGQAQDCISCPQRGGPSWQSRRKQIVLELGGDCNTSEPSRQKAGCAPGEHLVSGLRKKPSLSG